MTAKEFLKEAECTRGLDIANVVDEIVAKFKNSDEFTTLLKKDHDAGFDVGLEVIFYNIQAHYRDLDYAFLGGELTDLIDEWLEEERLNAPYTVSSPTPPGLLARNAMETETVPAEAPEQQLVVEVDEEIVAPNPLLVVKDPASELNSRVVALQPLINLKEELVATDIEEELKAAVNLTTI